uniref:GB1/RHD3-type G domain-containing protein n=1 Tax=Chrysemys picta bellii TaxID=8478 RepID=A0A8C3FES4_CHRPI
PVSIHTPQQEQSQFVTEGGRGGKKDSAEFVRFFPAFVWAVRDFTLQLELDGQEITEDEYLENALKLKPGRGAHYNLPRKCIRQFFPARKCFVFVQPAGRRDLPRLEELREDKLDSEFREQVAQFCRHVWETSKPKTLLGGHPLGRGTLGPTGYVNAIRSGAVPCMESAVLALAQIENSAAVGEAVAVYEEQLEWRAALPTESVQELLEVHVQCEREALWAFMARAFMDDDRRFQGELMVRPLTPEQKQELCRRNEVASSDRCMAALLELSQELDDRIGEGVYSVPGGYQRFLDDRQRMVDRYRQVPEKGVKADAALQEFLQSKEAVAQSILQTDEALTEKEKEMAAERARAEAAEREQQVLKQKEAELQQKLEDQDRSYQENLWQLETKLEDERKKLLEEQGKMMDQKLKVPEGPRVLGAAGDGWADQLRSTLTRWTSVSPPLANRKSHNI